MFGHVHQDFDVIQDQVWCVSTPSTCIQFKKDSTEFALEKLAPGYRIFDLHEDGEIETMVIRADSYIGTFLEQSEGY